MNKTLIIIGLLVVDYFGGMALSRGIAAWIFPILLLLFASEMIIWGLIVRLRKPHPSTQKQE